MLASQAIMVTEARVLMPGIAYSLHIPIGAQADCTVALTMSHRCAASAGACLYLHAGRLHQEHSAVLLIQPPS